MPPVISVENLSKCYLVGHNNARSEKYTALRDVLARNVHNLARKTRDMISGRPIVQGDEVEEFWALKDLSFEIQQGDRVGIIGRNGAGKSTLLKILSRITEPTIGQIKISGRVASLLEVGTGFHPELSGRENIFLNGAILGMSRLEIQNKFDEIVNFAEVEKFLDTPVKRYSSGMYVRLAFAVAAHLEPEILIIDEVLAVGDAAFQAKCLGKMSETSSQGRTVLFVSHNINAINSFCNRGIVLKSGGLAHIGSAVSATGFYSTEISKPWEPNRNRHDIPYIYDIYVVNGDGERKLMFEDHEKCFLKVKIDTLLNRSVFFGCTIFNVDGVGLFSAITTDFIEDLSFDKCCFTIELPIKLLPSGNFRLEGALTDPFILFEQSECFLMFSVVKNNPFDVKGNKSRGLLKMPGSWSIEHDTSK